MRLLDFPAAAILNSCSMKFLFMQHEFFVYAARKVFFRSEKRQTSASVNFIYLIVSDIVFVVYPGHLVVTDSARLWSVWRLTKCKQTSFCQLLLLYNKCYFPLILIPPRGVGGYFFILLFGRLAGMA